MILINGLSLNLTLFFELFELITKDKTFGRCIRISAISIFPEAIHLLVKIVDR